MSAYATLAKLPQACRQAVYDLCLVIADTKHLLGLRYGEWLAAPVLESAIAANAMAQDEFGHARLFYSLLDEFHGAGTPARQETPAHYRNLEVLDRAFAAWTDVVAANALIDAAVLVQLEALKDSRFTKLAKLVPKLVQEEAFHIQHARGWLLQIAGANERAKAALERALKAIWTPVLCWFGRPGDTHERVLLDHGIQDTNSEGLRTRWMERVGPMLEAAGLDLPLSNDAVTGEWILSSKLDWTGWDGAFRRFSHDGPDAETFEQIAWFSKHDYPVGSA